MAGTGPMAGLTAKASSRAAASWANGIRPIAPAASGRMPGEAHRWPSFQLLGAFDLPGSADYASARVIALLPAVTRVFCQASQVVNSHFSLR
jgi:hypothetical protein